ncbi:hypothetical protein FGLOB1_13752 [Fusarium globosum]|uniref:Uncharacterized protein n=1 Tax=Fusarium globosum TaxID=78864 RepID=A0A8H6CXX1_9HYPO|nr:hypothetical protein FGLOB1_13752 [Fusarium globosum]
MAEGRMQSESKLPFPPKAQYNPSLNNKWRKKRPKVEVKKLPKAELEFLRYAKTPDLLPNLWKLPEANRENILISSGLQFKSSYPERDEDISWSEDEDDRNLINARMKKAFSRLNELRVQYPDEKSDEGPKGNGDEDSKDVGIEYDSKKRRDWRAQFHGRGSPEANRIELKDPENDEDIIADILGRHPVRKTWLAIALPSLNEEYSKLSRGYYINAGAVYPQAFSRYVKEGANITLSTATHKSQMENCSYKKFELNLVLCMP